MMQMFPRTLVGGVSLPRMIIGSNWMLGYSHTGEAADELILSRNGNEAAIAEIVGTYLQYGIDAIMAPKFDSDSTIEKGIRIAEEQYKKRLSVSRHQSSKWRTLKKHEEKLRNKLLNANLMVQHSA